MCGIFGTNKISLAASKKALATFKYRGPDNTGFFVDEEVFLGHHRLAILDLDPRSNQPFIDEKEGLSIIFNGEIYNYRELKSGLLNKFNYRTKSDTEVLLRAYQKYGPNLMKYVKGMYAFAIYDKKKKKIYLFRDQHGIKPLYYYSKNGRFIFSSEIKGIIAALRSAQISYEFCDKSINLYLGLGYIPSPLSLYVDIFKLPPHHFLEYDLVKKEIIKVESVETETQICASEEEYFQLIEKKILSHLISDVPVGVLFSGGTDSSLIAAVLQKYKYRLETFSIRMSNKVEDEFFFNKISRQLGLKAHVYNFSQREFNSIYNDVMDKIDEPIADSSLFPTFYICKMAARKVKVILSGEGGDEFFFGYHRHGSMKVMKNYIDYELTVLDKMFLLAPSFRKKNRIFKKLYELFKQPLSYYLTSQMLYNHKCAFTGWKEEFRRARVLPMNVDKQYYLENDLLRKIDFATSYNSIEGRVPLVDIDIVKNSELFPHLTMKNDMLKPLLKKMLLNYLSANFVYRGKSGFGFSPRKIFSPKSPAYGDFKDMFLFFKSKQIFNFNLNSDDNYFLKKYPLFCLSLLFLYRSIINNERQ